VIEQKPTELIFSEKVLTNTFSLSIIAHKDKSSSKEDAKMNRTFNFAMMMPRTAFGELLSQK